MSLYNMVMGINPVGPHLLLLLGFDPQTIPRLRDCWLTEDGQTIILLTRTGGPNRQDYIERCLFLRAHPDFLEEVDAAGDETFAEFHYKLPPGLDPEDLEILRKNNDFNRGPCFMIAKAKAMGDGDRSPETLRVMGALEKALRPAFEKLGVLPKKEPLKGE